MCGLCIDDFDIDIDIYFVVHTFRFCVRFSFLFVAFANFNYDMEN